jgi:predicted HTH domain antitoxin
MSKITLECPDTVLRSLHETGESFAENMRLLSAVKLYELGKLSSGRAAELAGLPRVVFFHKLAEYGVPLYSEPPVELKADLETARQAANGHQ